MMATSPPIIFSHVSTDENPNCLATSIYGVTGSGAEWGLSEPLSVHLIHVPSQYSPSLRQGLLESPRRSS